MPSGMFMPAAVMSRPVYSPQGRRALPGVSSASTPLMPHAHSRCAPSPHTGLARQIEIIGVAALAAYQHRVFVARHRLADSKFAEREPRFNSPSIGKTPTAPVPASRDRSEAKLCKLLPVPAPEAEGAPAMSPTARLSAIGYALPERIYQVFACSASADASGHSAKTPWTADRRSQLPCRADVDAGGGHVEQTGVYADTLGILPGASSASTPLMPHAHSRCAPSSSHRLGPADRDHHRRRRGWLAYQHRVFVEQAGRQQICSMLT